MTSNFKRRKFSLDDRVELIDNRRNWRIYNCPVDLINQYISYAKLYFNNEVWRVLEKGMKLIMQEETEWKVQVEKRLSALEQSVFKKEKEEEVLTFGGSTS